MADGEGFTIGEPDDDEGDDAPQGGKRGRKPRRQDEITRAFAELRFLAKSGWHRVCVGARAERVMQQFEHMRV